MAKAEFSVLVGKTLKSVTNTGNEILFVTTTGEEYRQTHYQDCCESVSVEDVVGDLKDLIGSPILLAEEREDAEQPADIPSKSYGECEKWTFYELATVKGNVTIRWYGTSNGYYSQSVSFEQKIGNSWGYRYG